MSSAKPLRIASCMAPIADDFVRALAAYIDKRLGIGTEVVDDVSWQKREQWLDEGDVQLGWLCGLPYVWKADGGEHGALTLLAAPVFRGERYEDRAVYYSDVVVRSDSPFTSFSMLRGSMWAYNESRSHSGHLITRYQLAQRGLTGDFFGQVVAAGSHEAALAMILAGQIDASAIDSSVLGLVLEAQPDVGGQIRVLESWGPSPAPPWLVHRSLPVSMQEDLQQLFLHMHLDAEGRAALERGHVRRFSAVTDEDYDPIRHMARRAGGLTLGVHR